MLVMLYALIDSVKGTLTCICTNNQSKDLQRWKFIADNTPKGQTYLGGPRLIGPTVLTLSPLHLLTFVMNMWTTRL